ncbi:MAG TPA: cytochrome c-type biogenesis protein CcmH [Anaerolineales bacterium]|nr:cytochrome c-type biogenesis protein CcmH [Anaerolineales bacterium]
MKALSSHRITTYQYLLAALLALAFAFSLNFIASAQESTPTDDEVNRIAKQLYCPVCESTPLDVCPTEACRQWRDLIRTMLAEGKSEAEIKQYFVEHYGARVLAEPPNRIASYLVPAVVILLGVLLLLRGFQMWMKPSRVEAEPNVVETGSASVDPYVARLEEELKKQK